MADAFIVKRQFDAQALVNVRGTPSWTRLEPQSVTGDPRPGLEARVHDPLWLLCRQWQLGELEGDDAGTPLGVQLAATSSPITRWQAGAWDSEPPKPVLDLGAGRPLEPIVEDETGTAAAPRLRNRAEAGAIFLAQLEDAGFGGLRDAVVTHTVLENDEHPDPFDRSWPGLATLLAGRAVDAQILADALDTVSGQPGGLPAWLTPDDTGARDKVSAIAALWREWYREFAPAADPDSEAWVGDRLEYRFSVAARTKTGEVVLRAPEFIGGEVDWYTFDLEDGADVDFGTPAQGSIEFQQTLSATPLRFAGMPADRLWEFEDAAVNLAALQIDPHDLGRLLLVEFALTYANDWLVVPLDVPFGSVTTIDWLTYTNTFGERFLVKDTRSVRTNDPWRMFAVTTRDGTALDALVVPPATVSYDEGDAIEEVLFLRDENANLAWAVERVVQGPSGDARPRVDERTQPPSRGRGLVDQADLDYTLQTAVPDQWIPYLPVLNGDRSIDLVQGRMRRDVDPPTPSPLAEPQGRLLNEPSSAFVADAEIPREGVRVRRVPVLARRVDGRYERWTARRVNVGRGEGASGLGFDAAIDRRLHQ